MPKGYAGARIVGSCWACGGPATPANARRYSDTAGSTAITRWIHTGGKCQARAELQGLRPTGKGER